ncbi:MAG: Coenzyme F420 hydrogenase/dehydrogenase, beta subunit C-terminal domain, partial [Candidatus Thorarchaeota archaeon]|nr:Coenzyme F420 hydrogenase/dehydrogenase, beta subunit C-terminal domain [Candidatus Thorarchaeota archaeon]
MKPDVTKTLELSQSYLKENTKRYAFKKLEREIVKTQVCVECGTCVSNCPVDALTGEHVEGRYVPTLTGDCVSCGICYAMCPRTKMLSENLIGDFLTIWKAQSSADSGTRQDGGVASALLAAGLRKGTIDAGVVAMHSDTPWLPKTVIATSEEEALSSGGTIYIHTQPIAGMMDAFKQGHSKVAVVGTACNIDALTRLETHPGGFLSQSKDVDVTKIGLFCMESFDYNRLNTFLKDGGIEIKDVSRMTIASGKFVVTTSNGDQEWPVADLNEAAAKSCSYCHDLTAMNADITCGNIGS